MGMGFAPTWLRQVRPLLHKTTLTTDDNLNLSLTITLILTLALTLTQDIIGAGGGPWS